MKDLKEMVKTLEMLETKVVKASTSSATSYYLKACETLEHGIEEMTLSLLNQAKTDKQVDNILKVAGNHYKA